jgi:cytochrome c oxidase cbb3-type subunit 3
MATVSAAPVFVPAAAAATSSTAHANLADKTVDDLDSDKALSADIEAVAHAAYASHCAACHGTDLHGSRVRGVPNLADKAWLWGDATVDSELQALVQTLTYGIRSGHAKTRFIADMPAYAHDKSVKLNNADIQDLVDYLLQISGNKPKTAEAAARGKQLFNGAPNCFDCHSADATGNTDWGSPDLTQHDASAWLHGNDRASLTKSISAGSKGRCPAWLNKLDSTTINALAVWLKRKAG